MPLNRTPRKHKVETKALTDPKPAFVSLVKAGANQVPFLAVRCDGDVSLQERIKIMRQKGYEVARVEMKRGDQFPDLAAAQKWLTEGGYEGAQLVEAGDCFKAEGDESAFEQDSIVQIELPGEANVTVWVGKADAEAIQSDASRGTVTDVEVIDQATKDAAEAETRTAAEGAEGAEGDGGESSAEKDAAEAKQEGDAKPGSEAAKETGDDADASKAEAEETAEATKEAKEGESAEVKRQASEEDQKIIDLVTSEAARIAKLRCLTEEERERFDNFMAHFSEGLTLGEVLDDANDGIPAGFGEAVQAMASAVRNNILAGKDDGVRAVASDFGDLVVALAQAFQGSESAERAQKMINLFSAEIAEDEEEADQAPDNEVLSAIRQLNETVTSAREETDEAVKAVKASVEALTERVEKAEVGLSERVEALENKSQSLKGADEEGGDGSTAKKKDGGLGEIALRSSLGISNTSRDGGFSR